jgi:hypothetical protein
MRSILTSYGDEWLPIRSPGILRRDNSHVVRPSIAYLVSEGVYGEYRVLGVFTEHRGAQDFADHHKLGSGRYSADDKAQVEEVDLYGPGWRRPPSEVGDGEVMDPPLRLVLDEAATICPVPLDGWPSDFGSHEITLCPAFPASPARCVMNPGTLTATYPPPERGGYDSTNWPDGGPGWAKWRCRCGPDWAVPVNDPGKGTSWIPLRSSAY